MNRLGPLVAGAVLVAAAAVVHLAGPATAASTPTTTPTQDSTRTTLTIDGHHHARASFGMFIGDLTGEVTDSGATASSGSVELERRLPGQGWQPVRSASSPASFDFGSYGDTAERNVRYRAHYLGDDSHLPSYSHVVTVTTLWGVENTSSCPHDHCHLSGRLDPRSAHHRITVQVKQGHWKRYRVVHTDPAGRYDAAVAGSRHGTRYRIVVAGTSRITTTRVGYTVTS